MNHPSEWAKFFDERAGRYRYKHKGSGVVRDTLMAIGKTLKNGATNVAKKVVRSSAEKAGKKRGPKHQPPAKHQPRNRKLPTRKSRREMQ